MWIKLFFQKIKFLFLSESWTDLLVEWLHQLPWPYWLSCILLGILYPLSFNWNPSFRNNILVNVFRFIIIYGLITLWYLNKDLKTSLPNLKIFSQEKVHFDTIRDIPFWSKTLTVLPIILRGIFIVILILTWIGKQDFRWSLFMFSFFFPINLYLLFASKIIYIIFSIGKIKSHPIEINLFDLSSLYELSQLTRKLAGYLIPLSIFFILVDLLIINTFGMSVFNINQWEGDPRYVPISFVLGILGPFITLIAISVFVPPVFWIREKIIEEKERQLSVLGTKLQKTIMEQDQYTEEGNFTETKNRKIYIEALISRKEYIEKISNWPWETRVIREFFTLILIPIILSFAEYSISHWFGIGNGK